MLSHLLAKINATWRPSVSVLPKKEVAEDQTLEQPILDHQEQTHISTERQTRPETPTLPDTAKSLERTGQTQPQQALSAGFCSGKKRRSKNRSKGLKKNLKSK